MSSNNNTSIVRLNNLSIEFNRYFGIVIFVFGCLGNLLNIFILSQRSLRVNPCARLFLVSSISNLIAILSGLTSRILHSWNLDLTNQSRLLCKIRAFIVFPSRTAAYWFVMFATIDRWLLSSSHLHRRQLSTLNNIHRVIYFVVLSSIFLYVYVPICYDINRNHQPIQCTGKSKLCRFSTDFIYGFVTVIIPVFFMNYFTLKTMFNIRQLQRTTSIVSNRCRLWRKTDQRLLMMLIAQVILYTLFAFPFVIQRVYSTVTLYQNKSDFHNALESCLYNLLLLFSFIANGIPFYVYTLTGGEVFRREISNMLRCVCFY